MAKEVISAIERRPPSRRTAKWAVSAAGRLALLGLSISMSLDALAAWTADGSARVDSLSDDNVRLSADNEDSGITTTANVKGEVRQVTENSEVSAVAGATYLAYSGVQDLSDENILYGDGRGRWEGERTIWRLDGSVRRDVMLETVGYIRDPLATSGSTGTNATTGTNGTATGTTGTVGSNVGSDFVSPGNTVDQGSVEEQVRRIDAVISPGVDYQLSERLKGSLGYTYERLDYHNGQKAGLESSDGHSVSLGLERQVSETDILNVSARAARFNPDNGSSTDAYGMTVGWAHQFSESSGASFDIGANYSEQDGNGNTGLAVNLRAYRRTETGNIFVGAQRSLMPSGFGSLDETDRLLFGWLTPLTEKVDLQLTADAYKTSSTNNANSDNDRKYASAGSQIKWAITESFSVGATYRYTWVDRQSDPSSASSNAVGIFIQYQPQREI
jgi:hypothetical protein